MLFQQIYAPAFGFPAFAVDGMNAVKRENVEYILAARLLIIYR